MFEFVLWDIQKNEWYQSSDQQAQSLPIIFSKDSSLSDTTGLTLMIIEQSDRFIPFMETGVICRGRIVTEGDIYIVTCGKSGVPTSLHPGNRYEVTYKRSLGGFFLEKAGEKSISLADLNMLGYELSFVSHKMDMQSNKTAISSDPHA